MERTKNSQSLSGGEALLDLAPSESLAGSCSPLLPNGLNTFTALGRDGYGRVSSNTVAVTVTPTNSAYSYDLNGNLLGDGTRNFAYDDENQLIAVWQANAWSNSFAYDGKLRRRIERDYAWNTGTSGWQLTNEVHFVYDGNLVIQERNGNNVPQVTYTRGNDLSGTFQGAGGIGGLLARTDNTKFIVGDTLASAYYHCDGNGNVTCLMTPYGQIAAKYLYDPFGNTLAQWGALATANSYRFSSKEWVANAGLYYYLYRFYEPNLQRWLNRDPIQERGSENLYCFVENMPLNAVDVWGEDIGIYGGGTGDQNDPPNTITSPGRNGGSIGGKPVWVFPPKPRPPQRPPQPKPQCPSSANPSDCWKDPDPALKGSPAGWHGGCILAKTSCDTCCANNAALDQKFDLQGCLQNCNAKWGACEQGKQSPTPPNINPYGPY